MSLYPGVPDLSRKPKAYTSLFSTPRTDQPEAPRPCAPELPALVAAPLAWELAGCSDLIQVTFFFEYHLAH